MNLSIVVVTWRSAYDLRLLVRSMNRHLDPAAELVIVDNASPEGPEEEARCWRGPTSLHRMESNLGYGAAANLGVEMAGGDAVVLLNPDTRLDDDGLSRIAARALASGALVGPRLLNPDGSVQPSASGPPVGLWPWVGALVPGPTQPAAILRHTEPWRLEKTTPVTWLTGACVAGPREVLRRLGPFDPTIHLYGEDMDLGIRAGRAGVPSLFCPELCRVVHRGQGSAEQRFARGHLDQVEATRRAVLIRAYGAAAERRASRAQVVHLGLRVAAKRSLGRDARWQRAALGAALRARP
jgi:GT2 family glycosyltransferase